MNSTATADTVAVTTLSAEASNGSSISGSLVRSRLSSGWVAAIRKVSPITASSPWRRSGSSAAAASAASTNRSRSRMSTARTTPSRSPNQRYRLWRDTFAVVERSLSETRRTP